MMVDQLTSSSAIEEDEGDEKMLDCDCDGETVIIYLTAALFLQLFLY
jgi:hypothetical protein